MPSTMRQFKPSRSPAPLLGTRILQLDVDSVLEVMAVLNAGLATGSVERLAEYLGATNSRVLELAHIKSSTYHDRKKRRRPLSPDESGRVYRLAKVTEAAEEYFENVDAARRWLTHPKVGLGGTTPLEMASSAEGADYVVQLLGRMAYGVVS